MDEARSYLTGKLREFLVERDFAVSDRDFAGYPSFDITARRDDVRFIIKVLINIDTFREANAMELIKLASLVSASPMVIGDRASSGKLEQGVVYYRHSVPILSFETFKDYIDGDGPFITSGPGGYYVSIDGQALRRRREMLGYSIGYLSNKIGVSRRSISLYEAGSAVTVDIFLKLEELLDCDLRKFLNLMEIYRELKVSFSEEYADDFFREAFELMMNRGYEMRGVKRSPFDAVAKERVEDVFLVGLLEDLAVKAERIRAIKHISDVFGTESLVISKMNTTRENYGGCPVLNLSEIKSSMDSSEIHNLIEKRKSPS